MYKSEFYCQRLRVECGTYINNDNCTGVRQFEGASHLFKNHPVALGTSGYSPSAFEHLLGFGNIRRRTSRITLLHLSDHPVALHAPCDDTQKVTEGPDHLHQFGHQLGHQFWPPVRPPADHQLGLTVASPAGLAH